MLCPNKWTLLLPYSLHEHYTRGSILCASPWHSGYSVLALGLSQGQLPGSFSTKSHHKPLLIKPKRFEVLRKYQKYHQN